MPISSRSPLVVVLGVTALALFGLNFVTWAHGRLNERSVACAGPSRTAVVVSSRSTHQAVDVQARSASREHEAIRVLRRHEVKRALRDAQERTKAARVHVEALAAGQAATARSLR